MAELEAKIAAMRSGNANGNDGRDLSLVKGEYWQTRRVPKMAHHFTGAEFEAYLEAERFPGNTITDRMRGHVQGVRRALVEGKYVPKAVMVDEAGAEALDLAEMDVRSQAEGLRRLEQQRKAVAMFEKAIGYTVANGDPKGAIRRLLLASARVNMEASSDGVARWLCGGYKRVGIEGHERGVLVGVREAENGAQWLEIRDSGWHPGSLYGEVHRVGWEEASSIFAGGVAEGSITAEQARSVMGYRWQPFARVQVFASV